MSDTSSNPNSSAPHAGAANSNTPPPANSNALPTTGESRLPHGNMYSEPIGMDLKGDLARARNGSHAKVEPTRLPDGKIDYSKPIGMEINGKQIPVPAANATHGTPHSATHSTPRPRRTWVGTMDKFADGVDATLHAGKSVGKPIMGFAKGTAKVALCSTIALGALGVGIGALADRSAERSI